MLPACLTQVRKGRWPGVGCAMVRFKIRSTIQGQTQYWPYEQVCQAERVNRFVQLVPTTSPKVGAARFPERAPA